MPALDSNELERLALLCQSLGTSTAIDTADSARGHAGGHEGAALGKRGNGGNGGNGSVLWHCLQYV